MIHLIRRLRLSILAHRSNEVVKVLLSVKSARFTSTCIWDKSTVVLRSLILFSVDIQVTNFGLLDLELLHRIFHHVFRIQFH